MFYYLMCSVFYVYHKQINQCKVLNFDRKSKVLNRKYVTLWICLILTSINIVMTTVTYKRYDKIYYIFNLLVILVKITFTSQTNVENRRYSVLNTWNYSYIYKKTRFTQQVMIVWHFLSQSSFRLEIFLFLLKYMSTRTGKLF